MLGAKNPSIKALALSRGTSNLAEAMKQEDLKSVAVLRLKLFDDVLQKSIPPHETVEGWAAFDRPFQWVATTPFTLNLALRDSIGNTSDIVIDSPSLIQEDTTISPATIYTTGEILDLSTARIKEYSAQP